MFKCNLLKLVVLLTLLYSCGPSIQPKRSFQPSDFLVNKANFYTNLLSKHQDADGFITTDHCDALLFTGLLGSTNKALEINIEAAQDTEKAGRWYRRPVSYPECYSSGKSRSTISRDMLLGLIWFAYHREQLAILEDLWEYGESRDWFMGDGRLQGTDTVLNPLMIGLLAEAIYKLGGENHYVYRSIPFNFSKDQTGFKAHLAVLQILLAQELLGRDIGQKILNSYYESNKLNPLFAFGAGKYNRAENLLLNAQYWPNDRLPTTHDRCTDWLIQRDNTPSDWQPCDLDEPPVEHNGADFLFVAGLLLNLGK